MTASLLAQGGGQWIRVMLTIYSCVCFTLLWVGFAVALVVDRGWLDQLWSWLRGLLPGAFPGSNSVGGSLPRFEFEKP